ncbi:PXDN, partial [Branchiostoma lanceolatum]
HVVPTDADLCSDSGLRYCEVLKPYVSSPWQPTLELLPGDNVTLRCDCEQHLGLNAAGAIWMGWFKDNATASVRLGRFTYSEKNADNFSISYALLNVQPHDSGTYVCQAKSTGNLLRGNATGVHIMVAEPQLETPNITSDTPLPDSVDLGANVTLWCETLAYPHPLFNWTKDGKAIPTNHSTATDHMTIRRFSQSDEGLYACVAWNVLGEKHSQQLQLTAKPPDGGLPMSIIIAIVSGVTVFVIVVFITITVFVYRRRRHWKHCRLESDSDVEGDSSESVDNISKEYDFSVLCCKDDRSWAETNIVNKLEEKKQKGYFHYRDDVGGDSVFQFLNSIEKSRHIIVVYSPSATSDEWFQKGYQTAVAEKLDGNLKGRVVPVLWGGFERRNLPLALKDRLPLEVEEPRFFERLQRSLSKDSDYESAGPSPASSEESILDRISVI